MTTLRDGNTGGEGGNARLPSRAHDDVSEYVDPTASGRGRLPLPRLPRPSLVTVRARWVQLHGRLVDASERSRSVSVWASAPPSLAALAAYTAAGDWVPGERAPVLEFFGKAYGYLLVLPVTAAAYGVLWLLARPLRLGIALALIFALWIVW